MDILCHALESYTARWFGDFDAKRPEQRVPYCGANPIADMWAEKSLSLLAGAFRRAVHDGSDRDARDQMALAATFAGLGFGNAGVHVPHACAYPVAGRVRDYRPEGYPADEPIVPHGMAVVMTAPAALALIFDASPDVCACVVDPCTTTLLLCAPGTSCQAIDGEPVCTPIEPNPCAAVLCPTETTCDVVDGEAVCSPIGPNPCAAVSCARGSRCVARGDEAHCVGRGSQCRHEE